MSALDFRTLSLAYGLVCLCSLFVFSTLRRINRDIPGLGFWSAAALLVTIAFIGVIFQIGLRLYGLEGIGIALNTSAFLCSLALILEGVLRFQGLGQPRRRRPWLLGLCALIVVMAFINRANTVHRYLWNDLLTVLLSLAIGTALVWRTSGRTLVIHGVAAMGYAVMVFINAWRWVLAWQAAPGADLQQHPLTGLVFLGFFIHAVVWVETMNLAVNSRVQRRLQDMALHDELTGLPNRRAFAGAMQQAEARARRVNGAGRFGLVLIDMDGFKQVNDQHGHEAGDALLRAMAQRLQATLRGGDTACRLGGDEFVVLLEDCPSAAQLQQTVQRLRAALEAPLDFMASHATQKHKVVLQLRASIGSALYPDDTQDGAGLLHVADTRMYQQKSSRSHSLVHS